MIGLCCSRPSGRHWSGSSARLRPLLASPYLLDSEEGQDLLDVIRMQLEPGLLATSFPGIDWKGAMGFRDVIAHQYFDLDAEQVLLICQEALPGLLEAICCLEQSAREDP